MSLTELEIEKELDRIYDLEDLALEGRIDTWNTVLSLVDYDNIDPVFLLAYVISTRPWAEHLSNRQPIADAFYRRCPEYIDTHPWWDYKK